jgi:dTDP-4-amino-4,6-dideoxygalactose transaminase
VLSQQVLSLPIWPQITDEQQVAVADALRQALKAG